MDKMPDQVTRKLEQTLAQWHQWRDAHLLPGAPHIVQQLHGGVSNYNVLAEAAGQQFVIRIDGINPAANGLNRQAEWRALHAACDAGIAPRPHYFNPELGALVCDYLPPDDRQPPQPADLAQLLRTIHQLPALRFRLDIFERTRRYERQLAGKQFSAAQGLSQTRQSIHELLQATDRQEQTHRLCHNDLNPTNLLFSGGKLYALDWEYSAMGDPWFDLAVLCTGQELSAEKNLALLQQYLQRETTAADWLRLQRQQCIARYLELLWYLSQKPEHHEGVVMEKKLADLQSGLERLPFSLESS